MKTATLQMPDATTGQTKQNRGSEHYSGPNCVHLNKVF